MLSFHVLILAEKLGFDTETITILTKKINWSDRNSSKCKEASYCLDDSDCDAGQGGSEG